MIEAYKIILKESGSVRRAEELARRMKVKSQQEARSHSQHVRIVSEEIDKMQNDMEQALMKGNETTSGANGGDGNTKTSSVRLIRSRRETRIIFILKGGLEETENNLQRIYKAVISS
jgi:predicted DNA-binding protein